MARKLIMINQPGIKFFIVGMKDPEDLKRKATMEEVYQNQRKLYALPEWTDMSILELADGWCHGKSYGGKPGLKSTKLPSHCF